MTHYLSLFYKAHAYILKQVMFIHASLFYTMCKLFILLRQLANLKLCSVVPVSWIWIFLFGCSTQQGTGSLVGRSAEMSVLEKERLKSLFWTLLDNNYNSVTSRIHTSVHCWEHTENDSQTWACCDRTPPLILGMNVQLINLLLNYVLFVRFKN